MNFPGKALFFLILTFAIISIPAAAVAKGTMQTLSLEQIMADTDWLGNAPENSFWGADNRTVYYQQKR